MLRALLVLVSLVSVFFAPWWITALCALILAVRWRSWEVIVLGVFVDALWLPHSFFYGFPVATFLAIVAVWVLEPLRNELLVDQPLL